MTTVPRIRPSYDPELQVIHRIFGALGLLPPEARARVISYVNQRMDSLPAFTPASNGAAADDEPSQSLFDDAGE